MNSTKQTARIAGLLYLVNGVTGFFGIVYVPGKLIVSGNTAATASNILGSERLFRLGIVSELICGATSSLFLLFSLQHVGSTLQARPPRLADKAGVAGRRCGATSE